MDGSTSLSLARKDSIQTLDQETALHQQAATSWEDKGGTVALEECEEHLASSPSTNSNDGETTQDQENNAPITARYRYHLTVFQHMAFMLFLDDLEKTQDPHKQRVAGSLGSTEAVLETLDVLEAIKGLDTDAANAYRSAYGWVKPAWDAIVQALGLSMAEYDALMKFKKEGVRVDEYEEDYREEQAQTKESLQDLQSTKAQVLLTYKKPLVRLLRVLLA